MKNIILVFVLLIPTLAFAERPTVNLPIELRQANWTGANLEGSCSHATTTMLLNWQMQFDNASEWRSTYSGGDWADDSWNPVNNHARKFDQQAIDFAYTTDGDVAFLDWALSTRRGCGVTVRGGSHAVLLVHLDEQWAAIIDNNDINQIKWVPRDRLISEWKSSNGWSWTPVYSPAPPLPH